MGKLIDEVSRALASGVSRRDALAGLAAGAAATLPWTAAAKKRGKRKKKNKNAQFARFQDLCIEWCAGKFGAPGSAFDACVQSAKSGKGACYDPAEEGPGFYCLNIAGCAKNDTCCPGISVVFGDPIKDAECCPPGSPCLSAVNGTTGICL